MPLNKTPKPIDVLSQQVKDLQSEIGKMKSEILDLQEKIKIKDSEAQFEIVSKKETTGWWYS